MTTPDRPQAGPAFGRPALRVELLLTPDCPHAAAARAVLAQSLDQLGLAVPVHERVGAFPSPTVLVDGVDVMTGRTGTPTAHACRLDLPTAARLLAALPARGDELVRQPEDPVRGTGKRAERVGG